jgi:hypothetical protein
MAITSTYADGDLLTRTYDRQKKVAIVPPDRAGGSFMAVDSKQGMRSPTTGTADKSASGKVESESRSGKPPRPARKDGQKAALKGL